MAFNLPRENEETGFIENEGWLVNARNYFLSFFEQEPRSATEIWNEIRPTSTESSSTGDETVSRNRRRRKKKRKARFEKY